MNCETDRKEVDWEKRHNRGMAEKRTWTERENPCVLWWKEKKRKGGSLFYKDSFSKLRQAFQYTNHISEQWFSICDLLIFLKYHQPYVLNSLFGWIRKIDPFESLLTSAILWTFTLSSSPVKDKICRDNHTTEENNTLLECLNFLLCRYRLLCLMNFPCQMGGQTSSPVEFAFELSM